MIISKTPFRISFAGGGSDLPSFYQKHKGCVLSTTINKYMYLSIHPFFFNDELMLKYSKTEKVKHVNQIEHRIFREVLKKFNINGGLEISSNADVPAGTGLGSSSSFTVGLLHLLYTHNEIFVQKKRLAEEACNIEINLLKEPIGKQDQYAAAFGGLNFIEFYEDGATNVSPLIVSKPVKEELEKNLLMFYTGVMRSASEILKNQNDNMNKETKFNQVKNLSYIVEEMKDSLQKGNISIFGKLLHKGWLIKKELVQGITNSEIDQYYNKAMTLGAEGGKLLGAGGGGFFLFYCKPEKQERLKKELGLPLFNFKFENEGSKIIYYG